MSKEIELTRRKVLGSAAVVGAASAGAGAGTFAYFSDDETVEDNTIGAGTLELDVGDGGGGSFSYSFSEIAPGQSTTVSATIENTGTIDAGEVLVDTSTDTGSDSNNLATQLDIDAVRWNGTEITSSVSASTVQELTNNTLELTPAPASGGNIVLEADVTFNSGAQNGYQGVSVDVDHTFTLNQVEDQ